MDSYLGNLLHDGERTERRPGLSGKVACNTGTFGGDPIWYLSKACYCVSN